MEIKLSKNQVNGQLLDYYKSYDSDYVKSRLIKVYGEDIIKDDCIKTTIDLNFYLISNNKVLATFNFYDYKDDYFHIAGDNAEYLEDFKKVLDKIF